jgi:hypothetical protein
MEIASRWRSMLWAAKNDVIKRANKTPPPVDIEATEIHEAISHSMRTARGRAAPDPPPRFGAMSSQEFRNKVRDDYGFDPGV